MLSLIQSHLPRGLKFAKSRTIPVFCYHGVIEKRRDQFLQRNFHLLSDFREQVRFLRRQGVMSLAEFAMAFKDGANLRDNRSVITFDDGYANNLEAAEILAEAGLPWTVFVSTDAIGPQRTIWTVELSLLFLHGNATEIESLGRLWPLRTREERKEALQGIRYPLKTMSANARSQATEHIRKQFPSGETERLLEQFPEFQIATWEELRRLADSGVEIGSHGTTHELHHAEQDASVRRNELVESKKEIERRFKKSCRFFAFPNGDHCKDSPQELRKAGYELAFTTRQAPVQSGADRFLLPRITPGAALAKLKEQLRDLR